MNIYAASFTEENSAVLDFSTSTESNFYGSYSVFPLSSSLFVVGNFMNDLEAFLFDLYDESAWSIHLGTEVWSKVLV